MAKDYYKILGVGKSAGADEIKAAFRKLAHEHHPDKTGGNAEKFKEALEAYQVLSNAEKRQQYDQFGTTFGEAGAPGFGGFGRGSEQFDFGSVFTEFPDLSEIIGQMFGARGTRTETRRSRGRDIEKDLELTFLEAVFGATKTVELYSHVACGRCEGTGAEAGSKIVACTRCGGSGQTRTAHRTILGTFEALTTCDACRGVGKKPKDECVRCRGTGITRELHKLEVKIPPGAEDGGVVRVSDEGEAAPHGGSSGNLYLRLHVKSDPRFERHGQDIFSRVPVKFVTAAGGGTVSIETVDGSVELKIPAGTQSGALFRLRGKGVPHIRRAGRGDHIVEVAIEVPTKLSRKQRRLLEEFDEDAD
ncbi:molecular chaperone DnaJ [Candidatus Uhrbacteria bacterium]|nr:molecular chaperone DnaJ [Candidatus Uhrbacteria bacterium]